MSTGQSFSPLSRPPHDPDGYMEENGIMARVFQSNGAVIKQEMYMFPVLLGTYTVAVLSANCEVNVCQDLEQIARAFSACSRRT